VAKKNFRRSAAKCPRIPYVIGGNLRVKRGERPVLLGLFMAETPLKKGVFEGFLSEILRRFEL